MNKVFHNKLPNSVQVKYILTDTGYIFRNDKLFYIK